MTRFQLIVFAVIAVVLLGAAVVDDSGEWGAVRTSHDPHVAPADARVNTGTSDQAFTDWSERRDLEVWVAQYEYRTWIEGVERERIEQERLAYLARINTTGSNARGSVQGTTPTYGCNIILPDSIVQRESGGNCDAYNAAGCGGRGCLGYAQVDAGHFAATSPWNSNVAGTCYGLSYDDCVAKLWDGGAGAGHWR